MTDTGRRHDKTVGTRLYAASRHHAATARAPLDASDEYGRLDAAFHAGAAVELIAKAMLAEMDPCLLSDGSRAHHALLEAVATLRGRSDALSGSSGGGKTTVGATLALDLTSRLDSECAGHKTAARRVLQARNAAVHMAEAPTAAELAKILTDMEAFTDAAARFLQGSSNDYWGVRFEEVTREREAARHAIEQRAAAKVNAAAQSFESMLDGVSDELRSRLIDELQRRGGNVATLTGDTAEEMDCPACQHTATVAWDSEVDVEEEMAGEYMYNSYWQLLGLRCPVCGLALDADEVEILNLDVGEPSDEGWDDDEM